MIREVCVENFTDIPKAIEWGADRIELCDNLAIGGTTASVGVMQCSISYARSKGVPVMCIIRPRKGDFCYSMEEWKIMKTDIGTAKALGAAGVVIGALTKDFRLDVDLMKNMLDEAGKMQITFHMAFDEMEEEEQCYAIDWLSQNGVHRILTHGGKSGTRIEQNVDNLKRIMAYAGSRIIIMPGGGVTKDNAGGLHKELGFSEVHGTKIVGKL